MGRIKDIHARQILDSRGNPTVEAEVFTDTGFFGRAAVPSGASTGKYEAVELRDGDKSIYLGKSVSQAVNNITGSINQELKGIDITDQELIDAKMIDLDGSFNKSRLGANSMLAVSLACARAAAKESNENLFTYLGGKDAIELPIPMMNILNGGSHADNSIDFQEFMIMPVAASSFSEALKIGVEIFHHLKQELKDHGYSTNVGDEGGFAPELKSNEDAIKFVLRAIESAGYRPADDVYIAIDAAASEFYNAEDNIYHLKSTNDRLTSSEMVDYWCEWTKKYPIISLEDGLDEDDWSAWKRLTQKIGGHIQLVGDDLFVTNVDRLSRGVKEEVANSILIKVNQIGTLTDTMKAVNMAHLNSYTSIMSHRSVETEDTIIADLSVAMKTGQIKTGSASRSDRVAKYNQLLRIEECLGERAFYRGKGFKFI